MMKEVIEKNGIVFVRDGLNYRVYCVLNHSIFRWSFFNMYGKILWQDEKEEYTFKKLLYFQSSSELLKTISEFMDELNAKVK